MMDEDLKVLEYSELQQKKYGLDAAIFIKKFEDMMYSMRWEKHKFDGLLWISLSEAEIREILPFWAQAQIDKVIRKVIACKVMKKKRIYSISHNVCFAFVKNEPKE